jgi:NADPH:quinone reductase-like Zn-dependent oxidoreductase
MKAVRFHQQGGLDVLRYEDAPDPVIADDDVLIRVRACALNHLDIWVRSSLPGIKLPHISGSDVSGDVAAVGAKVDGLRVGDRVTVNPALSCGRCEFCEAGDDNLCVSFDILGRGCDGGYAELVKVPARNAALIPDSLSYEQAAAFPLVFLTSWHMLVSRAKLAPGETALIHAAGSGVGSAAVQIAKLCGAQVIATVGIKEKVEKAKEVGADHVINRSEQDTVAAVQQITGGRGADVVFEHVGPETWRDSMRCLAKAGRLVTCGATTGPTVEVDLRFMFSRQFTILGSMMGTKADFRRVADLVCRRVLEPVIDCTFPLKEAIEAQRRMESRNFFGKLLLLP